ncbi:MAG TPA: DUF4492 domain-containing protein [Candidatus Coprenecus stercoripullorum]|nr:DUF4492 domain-containing protein [Candidatus Coprenecus stercoripullorum]
MGLIKKIWLFYYDGFRSMTVGRTLWIVIIIKLFIIFAILRVFLFRPALSEYGSEEEKAEAVIENLVGNDNRP